MQSPLFSLFSSSILMIALYAQSASSQPRNIKKLMKTVLGLETAAVLVPVAVGYRVKASRDQSKIMEERDQEYERIRKLIVDASNQKYGSLNLNVDEVRYLAELPNMSDQQILTLKTLGLQLAGVRVLTPSFDDKITWNDESTLDEKMMYLDDEITVTVMKACCNIGMMEPEWSEEIIKKLKGAFPFWGYKKWTVRDISREPRISALVRSGDKGTESIIYKIERVMPV